MASSSAMAVPHPPGATADCHRPDQADEERAELNDVLACKSFKRAPNLEAILRYVCRESFEGREACIHEYSIAVNALGRPAEFDSTRDSVVRVEVSRLRRRLQQYYSSEGAGHAIHILLPDVGYVPRFVRQDLKPAELPQSTASAPIRRRLYPLSTQTIALVAAVFLGTVALAFVANNRTFRTSSERSASSREQALLVVPADGEPIRIAVGLTDAKFVDSSGRLWLSDRYATGGVTISKPERKIRRTLDPSLYQRGREGDFRYDIPLKPGVYELHLHMAEIVIGETLGVGAEGQRRFNVAANGKALLQDFDIVLDAPGADTANEKIFKNISPAVDGFLHLQFWGINNKPILSGIELSPTVPDRMIPVRILAGFRTYYDHAEQFWGADRYFVGGRSYERPVPEVGTDEAGLYSSERFGNFSYHIPLAEGRYSVTLRFLESNFGVDNVGTQAYKNGGVGSRVFDVYCNGVTLLKDFDVLKVAGGPNRAVQKTFRGLRPNSQGKLVLTFVSVRDYPMVRAIEVVEDVS